MHPGSVNARDRRQFRCDHRRHSLASRPLLHFVAVTLLALAVLPSTAVAQGVGAVTGTIRNGETGERLDYANVVLESTSSGGQYGAMSLGGGRFFLNGSPAGSYTLKVRYLGFKHVNGPAKWSSYAKAGTSAFDALIRSGS